MSLSDESKRLMMHKLRWAIYRVGIAGDYYEMCCADVWREFQSTDPDLAKEVEKLGLTEEGTAEWICPNPSEGMASAASNVNTAPITCSVKCGASPFCI